MTLGSVLAEAYVRIKPDTDGFRSSLHDDLGRAGEGAGGHSASRFGSAFKSGLTTVAKTGAIAFGAAFTGALVIGKQSVDAASNLEESISKVNVVFGDAAASVLDWSKTSATAFGTSQQKALEAAGTYGNLFKAFGIGDTAANDMSTSLAELAADLASFNNTSVEDALAALQSGVSGETEPLKRFGVAINDVRLKEEALRLGLISSTKDALTPAAKAQAAYALIMKDTTLAQGDFARTSDGLANKQRIMAATFENAKASIGKALIPAMTAAATFIADKFIPAAQEVAERVMPYVKDAFAAVGDWLQRNWPTISAVLQGAWDVIRAGATWVRDTLFPIISDVFGAIVQWVQTNWPTISEVVQGVFTSLGDLWNWLQPTVIQPLMAAFQEIVGWVQRNWPTISAVISGVFTAVQETIKFIVEEVFPRIVSVATEVINGVSWAWTNVLYPTFVAFRDTLQTVIEKAQAVWDKTEELRAFLADAFKLAWDIVRGAIDLIVTSLTTVWNWTQTVWDRLEPFRAFLADAFFAAIDLVRDAIDKWRIVIEEVWNWVQTLWDRAEPFRAFLADAFFAAVDTIRDVFDKVRIALEQVWNWTQTLWDRLEPFREFLSNAFSGAVGVAIEALGKVVETLQDIIATAKEAWGWLQKINPFGDDGDGSTYVGGVFPKPGDDGDDGGNKFHSGGWVPGFPGQEMLATVRGGERVLNPVEASRYEAGQAPGGGMPWAGQPITLVIEGRPFTAMMVNRDREQSQRLLAGVAT